MSAQPTKRDIRLVLEGSLAVTYLLGVHDGIGRGDKSKFPRELVSSLYVIKECIGSPGMKRLKQEAVAAFAQGANRCCGEHVAFFLKAFVEDPPLKDPSEFDQTRYPPYTRFIALLLTDFAVGRKTPGPNWLFSGVPMGRYFSPERQILRMGIFPSSLVDLRRIDECLSSWECPDSFIDPAFALALLDTTSERYLPRKLVDLIMSHEKANGELYRIVCHHVIRKSPGKPGTDKWNERLRLVQTEVHSRSTRGGEYDRETYKIVYDWMVRVFGTTHVFVEPEVHDPFGYYDEDEDY